MHFAYFVGVQWTGAGVYGGQDFCLAWVSQNPVDVNGATECKVSPVFY